MPAGNAFTGFSTNGENEGTPNATGTWDSGWDFNNKLTAPDATVYFPATGYIAFYGGPVQSVGSFGEWWSAAPDSNSHGYGLGISQMSVSPLYATARSCGHSVRPVADE